MKKCPPGWPRISSSIFYQDAAKAIDWLTEVFGFEVKIKVVGEGGRIEHSELTFGEGLVMVSSAGLSKDRDYMQSPLQNRGANTQCLFVYVDDVEAHFQHAKACGAVIVNEPKTSDYGDDYWVDRTYAVKDLEGHHWWFGERLKTGGHNGANES